MKTAVLLIALLPVGLAAQESQSQLTFAGTAAHEIMQTSLDGATQRYTGMILGAEGLLVGRSFVARVRYAQGRVNAKDVSADPRDLVEGEALVGLRVTPWLTVLAGPRAWAHTTGDADERWLLWTGRVAARGSLIPTRMQTFVEVWGALSGSHSNPAGTAGGRGANAGLEMRLGAVSSFWGRLGYRIESAHAEGRETVEALTLSIIYGIPQ
jgi:hypothetical protein